MQNLNKLWWKINLFIIEFFKINMTKKELYHIYIKSKFNYYPIKDPPDDWDYDTEYYIFIGKFMYGPIRCHEIPEKYDYYKSPYNDMRGI